MEDVLANEPIHQIRRNFAELVLAKLIKLIFFIKLINFKIGRNQFWRIATILKINFQIRHIGLIFSSHPMLFCLSSSERVTFPILKIGLHLKIGQAILEIFKFEFW